MNIRGFFTKKRIIWLSIVVIVAGLIGYNVYKSKTDTSNIITEASKQQDIKQTVLATGQVSSNVDLSLSFKGSGVIKKINVKVGDKVSANQILANLEQRDQQASLTSARGALASAQANYKRVLDGATSEEVDVAQKSVDAAQVTLNNAKTNLENVRKQQDVLVQNARSVLYSALTATSADSSTTPTITGSYNSDIEGKYTISTYATAGGARYSYSGLENGSDWFSTGVPLALGTRGLFVQFASGTTISGAVWEVSIPNTSSSSYGSNLSAYNAALQTRSISVSTAEGSIASAQASLDQAIASLNLKKAQAKPADVQAAQAQVLSAQGQVEAALSAFENTIIRAAANGTITKVDIKVGEQASPSKEAVVLQDIDNLYLEANISEANVASIKTGQSVDVTFDALGPERKFTSQLLLIDPASTVISGVVNYKITSSIDQLPEIRPGMTANMTILTNEKANVVTVPQRAVINKNGGKYLRVITDPKRKTYKEVEIQVGLSGDGGIVEVVAGVTANTEVVTFIEEK